MANMGHPLAGLPGLFWARDQTGQLEAVRNLAPLSEAYLRLLEDREGRRLNTAEDKEFLHYAIEQLAREIAGDSYSHIPAIFLHDERAAIRDAFARFLQDRLSTSLFSGLEPPPVTPESQPHDRGAQLPEEFTAPPVYQDRREMLRRKIEMLAKAILLDEYELGWMLETFDSVCPIPQTASQEAKPSLPPKVGEFWSTHRAAGENPPQFIERVYGPWIGNGLRRVDIRHTDRPLYDALATWLSRTTDGQPNELWFELPTKAASFDDNLPEQFGDTPEEQLRELERLAAALRRRVRVRAAATSLREQT